MPKKIRANFPTKKPDRKPSQVQASSAVSSASALSSKPAVALLTVVFLLSRLYLALSYNVPETDLPNYLVRALQYRAAWEEGTSIYKFNQQIIDEGLVDAKFKKSFSKFEYPPLAFLWMAAPMLSISQEQFISRTDETGSRWLRSFKLIYFFFDALIFGVAAFLALKPKPSLTVTSIGLGVYTFGGLFMLNFLYDRMDLWLGGMIFISVILLLGRRHWAWSFLVLAAAINFKLVPLILIPFFILGSLPFRYVQGLGRDGGLSALHAMLRQRGFLMAVAARTASMTAMTLGFFIPFYLCGGGDASLGFVTFFRDRGLQLESTYSSVIMLCSFAGLPARVTHGFGSYNIDSPWNGFFLGVSTPFTLAALAVIFFLLLFRIQLRRHTPAGKESAAVTIAQAAPQLFAGFMLAALLAVVVTAKVLSAQFVLWTLPLFMLINFKSKRQTLIFAALAMGIFIFTFPIFPYLYQTDFVHGRMELPDGRTVFAAPTLLATLLLLTRNLLLATAAVLTIVFSVSADRRETMQMPGTADS